LFISDVKFLYLAPGSKDNYKELVEDPTTDIITVGYLTAEADKIAAIDQVTERIKHGKLFLPKLNRRV
jgi:ppGpp synthetase/RelA/SpoT-type nucleotidyltranferase